MEGEASGEILRLCYFQDLGVAAWGSPVFVTTIFPPPGFALYLLANLKGFQSL